MLKKVGIMIFIALAAIIIAILFRFKYENYIEKKEQQQEEELIKEEKRENQEQVIVSDIRERNLDELWQHVIEIENIRIILPIKYEDLKERLANILISESEAEYITLKNGEKIYLQFDNKKHKSVVYGISTKKNINSSCLSIQNICIGMTYKKLTNLYEQPVTREKEENLVAITYADPKSDLDITNQHIKIYLQNDRIVGLGMYFDGSAESE